jgi:hypothetical protein
MQFDRSPKLPFASDTLLSEAAGGSAAARASTAAARDSTGMGAQPVWLSSSATSLSGTARGETPCDRPRLTLQRLPYSS